MRISDALNTEFGSLVISMILGLGLAAIFQEVCNDDDCIILEPPNHKYIKNNIFQFKEGCYKFDAVLTECDSKKKIIKKQQN